VIFTFFVLGVVRIITKIEFFFLVFLVFIMLRKLIFNVEGWVGVTTLFLFDGMSLLLTILTVWVTILIGVAIVKTDAKNSSFFFFF
jgi:hypothetical protein